MVLVLTFLSLASKGSEPPSLLLFTCSPTSPFLSPILPLLSHPPSLMNLSPFPLHPFRPFTCPPHQLYLHLSYLLITENWSYGNRFTEVRFVDSSFSLHVSSCHSFISFHHFSPHVCLWLFTSLSYYLVNCHHMPKLWPLFSTFLTLFFIYIYSSHSIFSPSICAKKDCYILTLLMKFTCYTVFIYSFLLHFNSCSHPVSL